MKKEITWKGHEHDSVEHCVIETSANGIAIQSRLSGYYKQVPFAAAYRIFTDTEWKTLSFSFGASLEGKSFLQLNYRRDDSGRWYKDGQPAEEFDDCTDIDILVTPFTNSLPINRIVPDDGQIRQIDVVYVDVWEQRVKKVRQQYTRLSANHYKFENVPNDFEAVITIDDNGLVEEYPGLFSRVK